MLGINGLLLLLLGISRTGCGLVLRQWARGAGLGDALAMRRPRALILVLFSLWGRWWARDGLGGVVDVKLLVNILGDGLDFCAKFLLDAVKVESRKLAWFWSFEAHNTPVIPANEVDGKTQMSKTSRTSNAMKIGFRILGEVKVDDNVHCLDIDTTGEEIGTHEISADAIPEVVKNAVTVLLSHTSMTVVARVAQLGNLLCKKLDTVGGVAEDDGLIDLEL